MSTLWKVLTRKKTIDPMRAEESSLARVLNTFDLTFLGVGSTLGVGMYVLVGKVAKETAGPAVVLSFLIAAVASAFAGLCYAEFGARTPRAGSAYVYSYVCVGEFVAFIIGWNLILEYIIGSASVAKGMSLYIDSLLNDTLKTTFKDIAPINASFLSTYFDFLSFGIPILLSIGLAFGMKESSRLNNAFTILNIFVIFFVIIAGATKADSHNWNLEPPLTHDGGKGGFFPFGISGMIKGAATCFYGFVGFDCIATTGEEVKNPQKAIPFAIVLSLLIVFLAYFATSTVVTLMVPYYLQDVDSPIPHAFEDFGWEAAKWIVTIGGIFALCASLFGAMFPLPRIIYAMASDGLVFKFLGQIHKRFSTPVIGTLLAGLLTGVMAAMFDQGQLVDMMSIGTLLAYTIVAACVLLLRYSVEEESYDLTLSDYEESVTEYSMPTEYDTKDEKTGSMEDIATISYDKVTFSSYIRQTFNIPRMQYPSKLSAKLVAVEIFVYCLLCITLGLLIIYLKDAILDGASYAITLVLIVIFLMIMTVISIGVQPKSTTPLYFKVPLVPLIPALSILVNIYLMLSLDSDTWIRFGVWMAIGLPIYFFNAPYKRTKAQKIIASKRLTNSYTNQGYEDTEANSDSAYFEGNDIVDDRTEKQTEMIHLREMELEKSKCRGSVDISVGGFDIRKISVDTVSNHSVVHEDVVAIVHREDNSIVEVDEDVLLNEADIPAIVVTTNETKNESYTTDEVRYNDSIDIIMSIPSPIEELDAIIRTEEEKLNPVEVAIPMGEESPETFNRTVLGIKPRPSTNSALEALDEIISAEEQKLNDIYTPSPPPPPLPPPSTSINHESLKTPITTHQSPPPPPPPPINRLYILPANTNQPPPPPPPLPSLTETIPKRPSINNAVQMLDDVIENEENKLNRSPKRPPPSPLLNVINDAQALINQKQKLRKTQPKNVQVKQVQEEPKGNFKDILAALLIKRPDDIPKKVNVTNSNRNEPKTHEVKEPEESIIQEKTIIESESNNDNIDLSFEDKKKKLTNLLNTPINRFKTVNDPKIPRKNSQTFPRMNDQDLHKMIFQNTLSRIKLRKTDSLDDES